MTTETTETYDDTYVTDDAHGENWSLYLGDSCERLAEIETGTVDLSVCSPPFAQLFNYSPSPRDLSNSANRPEFFEHYRFIIREQLRVTRPGRVAAVHVADIATFKTLNGVMGMTDFSGEVIRAFQDEGWIYDGRITVDKDPQAQAIRTKSHSLLFVTKDRDASMLRPAIPDYLLKFRKPGDNPIPVKSDVTNEEWIVWARAIWMGIRESRTLNYRTAKDSADERHICPLQLDFIERCVRLWSNPGELVLTPFAGIGSEVYTAVKLGRRGVGVELKVSYWKTAVDNMRRLDSEMALPSLFDGEES